MKLINLLVPCILVLFLGAVAHAEAIPQVKPDAAKALFLARHLNSAFMVLERTVMQAAKQMPVRAKPIDPTAYLKEKCPALMQIWIPTGKTLHATIDAAYRKCKLFLTE